MDTKQIIAIVRGISVRNLVLHLNLSPTDFYKLLESKSNEMLSSIDKLPLKVELRLKEIRSITINQDSLNIEVSLSTTSEKLLIPNIQDLLIDVVIPYDVRSKKLQLRLPEIKTKIASSAVQNTVVNPILKQVLQSNESKLQAEIENKINPVLSDPSKIKNFLPKELSESLEHLINNLNYEIHDCLISHPAPLTQVQSTISISTFDESKEINHIGLKVKLDSKLLIPLLLEKINTDINSKVEQDVSLKMINLTKTNTLVIVGRAGVMNIQKEFQISTELHLNQEEQIIFLKVISIDIDGGFLVRKGFEIVKPKIKSMIESTAVVPLHLLLEKLDIPFFQVDDSAEYHISTKDVEVESFILENTSNIWNLELKLSSGVVTCERKDLVNN